MPKKGSKKKSGRSSGSKRTAEPVPEAKSTPTAVEVVVAERPAKRQRLKTRFTEITKDNVGALRKLNLAIFPVTYNEKFYNDLVKGDEDLVKLAYHCDVMVGALCCREENKDAVPAETASSSEKKKAKKPAAVAEPGRRRVYIMTLGVLAVYRDYGVGSSLLQYIIEHVEKSKYLDEIYLHVQVTNTEAIQFYERYGFENVELIKNYYKRIQPPDCYLLRRVFEKSAMEEESAPEVPDIELD